MKKRLGFVSNSSSSSFICEVCGNTGISYDGVIEMGVAMCEDHCHTFCLSHAVNTDKPSHSDGELAGEDPRDYENFQDCCDQNYDYVPSVYCPICNLEVLSDTDFIRYMELKGMGKDKALKEIKEKFGTYEAFHEALE